MPDDTSDYAAICNAGDIDELCEKWQYRDPHLPVTGVIIVPPGIEVDLNGSVAELTSLASTRESRD